MNIDELLEINNKVSNISMGETLIDFMLNARIYLSKATYYGITLHKENITLKERLFVLETEKKESELKKEIRKSNRQKRMSSKKEPFRLTLT